MAIEAIYFGYWVGYNPDTQTRHWKDTGDEVKANPRPCPKCNQLPNENGYDPCIGHIEGAVSACCGHGICDGNILWKFADEPRDDEGFYR